jgi:2-methylcitrate dehydratase PrpD
MTNAAQWVINLQSGDLPPTVCGQLKRAILDGLGTAFAGTQTRTARIAAQFAAEMSKAGPATVLATGARLAVAPAVLANTVAANALDIDDGYRLVKGHPGAFLITPAIAAAQERGADHLLTAIAAGYEIALRAGIATHRFYSHYHASGSWGALGTAACLGKILGLDVERLRWAFGLAEYHAPISPIERCLGTPAMTKDGIAWGAFAGACAASLAEKGFTGNPSLLDDPRNEDLLADLGQNWRLLDLYFKPYPCCRWAQPAVDGALLLKREHGLASADVRKLIVHTFREATQLQMTPPATTEEAQYSLTWPIAAALVHGEVGPRQVVDEALNDPAMRAAVEKIEAQVGEEIQARFPAEALSWVEIETTDGRRLRGSLMSARGDPQSPLSDAELEAKFLRLVEPVLGRRAVAIRDAVSRLEDPDAPEELVRIISSCLRYNGSATPQS